VAPPRFGERLGYARWLYHLVTGAAPSHAEIGREVGRTGPAVGAWMEEQEPPSDYRVHAPLAAFLGVEEGWLIRDAGEPPRAELWAAWTAERRRAPRLKLRPAKEPAAAAKKRA
jgi:hypothetical protein